jgi:CheY-like chemotaxis protein
MKTKKTVLIVDDNPIARDATALMVNFMGYKHDMAESGEEALRKAALTTPDAIILDINMGFGKMDGIEVCRAIKSNPDLKDVYVMIISGMEDDETIQNAKIAKVDAYIQKPYNPHEVKDKLQKALK